MNKKFWLFAALCAGLSFTACTNDDEPQIEKPVTDNDWITPDGRVIVQLGGSSSKIADVNTATRAPLTPEKAHGTEIGIFALATTQTDNETVSPANVDWEEEPGVLLKNIKGTFITEDNEGNPVYAPKGSEENAKKITLSNVNGEGVGYLYYYPIDNKYTYTFYGYTPYALNTSTSLYNVTCDGSTASVQYKKFDGSQDIMWDKAIAPIIPKGSTLFLDENNLRDNVLGKDLFGYKSKYIRLLKYHDEIKTKENYTSPSVPTYNWVPNLALEHQLAQLRFYVVTASKQSSQDKQDMLEDGAKTLHVTKVNLQSHPTDVTLDIPTGELNWEQQQPVCP